MRLTVRQLGAVGGNGGSRAVEVAVDASVRDLKESVQLALGTPVAAQRLVYAGRQLDDDGAQLTRDHGVADGQTVYVAPKPVKKPLLGLTPRRLVGAVILGLIVVVLAATTLDYSSVKGNLIVVGAAVFTWHWSKTLGEPGSFSRLPQRSEAEEAGGQGGRAKAKAK